MTKVRVKVSADLSHTGKSFWKLAEIDDEIAPLVKSLQEAGIDMRGSCSGHGKRPGEIILANKKVINLGMVKENEVYKKTFRIES